MNKTKYSRIKDCTIAKGVIIHDFVNLYGCQIGDNTKIGAFVEIQKNVKIGRNVKISSHSFICEGVTIDDEVFIGHHVVFINDKYPVSTTKGRLKDKKDWTMQETTVKKGASLGSNVTVLGGLIIGENAVVGAGSVVTKDVLPNQTVVGNPARVLKK